MSEGPSVRPPSQARSLATMERFVHATQELLEERPFEDITVADIVRRAERTVGSFYARFEDKDAVLRLLLDRLDTRIRDTVHAFCDPVRWEGAPVADFIAESVKLNVHAYRRSGPLFRAALATLATDEGFRERRRHTMQHGAESQKAFLLGRQAELGVTDVARASDAVFETVSATLDHELLYGRLTVTSPATDGELIEDLTRRCLDLLGIAAPPPEDLVVDVRDGTARAVARADGQIDVDVRARPPTS
jgi:AcrR family transcriptional regulator